MSDDEPTLADLQTIERLILEISPQLKGVDPAHTFAVLADLVAMLIAGHIVPEELGCRRRPETDALREIILTQFVGMVRDLIPGNEVDSIEGMEMMQ
jgi:hypothetical protein